MDQNIEKLFFYKCVIDLSLIFGVLGIVLGIILSSWQRDAFFLTGEYTINYY